MAGDWIKVEVSLTMKPEVWRIAAMTGLDADAVVGKLIRAWAWFDAHTENGNAAGVTFALLDSVCGRSGFADAMSSVGWLEQDGDTMRLPNFGRHNGKTAKNRALTAKRVASHKGKSNASSVTDALPREEKRREEKKAIIRPPSTDARLAEVTREAMAAYNEHAAAPLGLARATEVGIERKQAHVRRCIKVARDACKAIYGSDTITTEFWADYFRVQAADDFIAGRTARSKEHANWRPDFEYLTRPDVITRAFEKATQ